jgi:hypothetical protein
MVWEPAEGYEGVVDPGRERRGAEEGHGEAGGPEEPDRRRSRRDDAGDEETFEKVGGAAVVGGHALPVLGRRSDS